MLPKRRDPVRSGIQRAVKREWPRHRKWVRSHECCASLHGFDEFDFCEGPIEFMHVRSAANAGTALLPFDWFGVPGCSKHHKWQHVHGAESFQKRYGVNLWELAAEFARLSPDKKMKEAMNEAGND